MNTWRDIKTAPLNEAVFATDGDMVFFGRFAMTADRKCMFEGQDIEEACNYGIEPACLTGWQPIPDTWKPEKSADEMFRELGYEKVDDLEDDVTRYVRYPYEIRWMQGKVFKLHNGYGKDGLTENEILAVAQLLKEMEDRNG